MTHATASTIAPDLALIEQLAHDAVLGLPEPYRAAATAIVLRIEDFAPDEILEAMDLNDPFELTGLYDGIPLTEKSVMDQSQHPDVIWLFRRPILDEWVERGDVVAGRSRDPCPGARDCAPFRLVGRRYRQHRPLVGMIPPQDRRAVLRPRSVPWPEPATRPPPAVVNRLSLCHCYREHSPIRTLQ